MKNVINEMAERYKIAKDGLMIYVTLLFVLLVIWNTNLLACTAFYMKIKDRVLVGNNEDGSNPETKIWIVPAEKGSYGRMYFGFSDLSAQGGINEKGLWFDAFSLPFKALTSAQGDIYPGDLQDKLMGECATVNDVLKMLKQYNRSPMARFQWMFGDREGNSVIVQEDTIILRQNNYQVATNFRQSQFPSGKGYECNRYQIANDILKTHPDADINTFRNILSVTHSEGQDETLYSYIVDLTKGIVYVYHFHDFENVVVFDIGKELAKGKHVYDLPDLFPKSNAAQSFEYRARLELQQLKASHRDKNFDSKTYPEYYGHYIITSPDLLAKQTITISEGTLCLNLQLNDGGPYEVIPEVTSDFAMLSYGGVAFACKFHRDLHKIVNELVLDGSGILITAKRIE